MIGHVRGRVTERDAGTVIVDVDGVGYLVHVADPSVVPAPGGEVHLHTSLQVRDDAMDLYGFPDRDALRLFEQLMSASGVGPKLALAALRTHRPATLRRAIAEGDLETLKAVPGVGDKSAQRLVVELEGDITLEPSGAAGEAGGADEQAGALAEVRDALLALGYNAGEAQAALGELDLPEQADNGDLSDGEVSELVREALRGMGTPTGGSR